MMTSQPNGPTSGSPPESPGRQGPDLSYMHRPPTILPNYGKKYGGGVKLKTNVPRVLLYDNMTQQTILDFQLNGLQSQQYKTYREMEMHTKSFILRSKARERGLKNITKVPHFSDYEEFLEQFEQNGMVGLRSSGRSLPRINGTSANLVSSSHNRRKKPRPVVKRNSDQSLSMSSSSGHYIDATRDSTDAKEKSVLPSLESGNMPTSANTVTSPRLEKSNSKSENFEPKRHVGFKMEKGAKGMTRIFHTLPALDMPKDGGTQKEPTTLSNPPDAIIVVIPPAATDGTETADNAPQPPDAIGAIEEANLPVEGTQNSIHKSEQPTTSTSEPDATKVLKESTVEEVLETNIDGPTQDYRFEKLARLLIPQDPPSDGFLALSPSFVRKYPDTAFFQRFKRPGSRPSGDRTRDDIRSALSTFSVLSGDLDDDEPEEPVPEKHGDNALGRLGNC